MYIFGDAPWARAHYIVVVVREMARLDAKLSMFRKSRSVARYFLTARRIDFITIILVGLKEG